ncbi:MAG: hypothetical protein J6B98_05565, partial [Bacilli bacterium]|nr:hypothetical protein [Bacilli bacterium]
VEEEPIFETPFVQEDVVEKVKPQMPIIEEEVEDNIFTDNIVSEIEESVAAIDIDNLFQTNLETIEEPKVENEDVIDETIEEVTTVEEPKLETPKVEAPFSSVFTNNEVVTNTVEPKKETKVFELPKMVEMPKLKEESKEEKVSDFDSLFEDIEPETYNINK